MKGFATADLQDETGLQPKAGDFGTFTCTSLPSC